MNFVYTVGVKRRFLPGYTKYRVTAHKSQFDLNGYSLRIPRLVLTLADGSELALPGALDRGIIIYPDFKSGLDRLESEAQEKLERAEADEAIKLYEAFKASKQAGQQMSAVVPIPKQA